MWQRHRLLSGMISSWLLAALAVAQPPQEARLTLHHQGFTQLQRRGEPLAIDATIVSPAGIRKAEVFCRTTSTGDFTPLTMQPVGEHIYRAVVPDWLTTGAGLAYYITATDHNGQSTSQGFVGFPLYVQFASGRSLSSEERLKLLQENLEGIRRSKERPAEPGNPQDPLLNRRNR